MNKKICIITLFLIFAACNISYAKEENSFNLAGLIESIINYQNENSEDNPLKFDAKENFLYAANKFIQGNVVVAYSEYEKTIDMLDKNFALLMFSKKLYSDGFFSLGNKALSKISTKSKFGEQIQILKDSYLPSYELSKEEEMYLARAYTTIYYNNSPEEVAFNLIKKDILLENSDYANFILAQSLYECRQYMQALIYVNKAIEKNNTNSNYKYLKTKILIAYDKPKEALKYIEELEAGNQISVYFQNEIDILKQQALSNLAKNEQDKKFYQIYGIFLSGNYYKALKETTNALSFNKNNYKILTLQAMSRLASGDIEEAKSDIKQSYKINKKFPLTIMCLADLSFIQGEYENSLNMYKTLTNSEYKEQALTKIDLIYNIQKISDKQAEKNKKMLEKINKNMFYEYYLIANNILNENNENYKRLYTAKALALNPLFLSSWNILFDMDLKKDELSKINNNLFILSFLDTPNAEYYYYSAVSLDKTNNKKEAFFELKKALNINPDYKPAYDMINRLQNELI